MLARTSTIWYLRSMLRSWADVSIIASAMSWDTLVHKDLRHTSLMCRKWICHWYRYRMWLWNYLGVLEYLILLWSKVKPIDVWQVIVKVTRVIVAINLCNRLGLLLHCYRRHIIYSFEIVTFKVWVFIRAICELYIGPSKLVAALILVLLIIIIYLVLLIVVVHLDWVIFLGWCWWLRTWRLLWCWRRIWEYSLH